MCKISDMHASLGAFQTTVDRALRAWSQQDNTARLWRGDASLWSGADEAHGLGWLTIASEMRDQVAGLRAFARQVRDRGPDGCFALGHGRLQFVPRSAGDDVWSPQRMARVACVGFHCSRASAAVCRCGPYGDDPVRCGEQIRHDDRIPRILRVLLGKDAGSGRRCGGTAFCRDYGSGFRAGSARQRRDFLAVFHGVAEIGGRFSALSQFGMLPAALIGIDVQRFLERAVAMGTRCKSSDAQNPGLSLGPHAGRVGKSRPG